jgi:hypothetical protein
MEQGFCSLISVKYSQTQTVIHDFSYLYLMVIFTLMLREIYKMSVLVFLLYKFVSCTKMEFLCLWTR